MSSKRDGGLPWVWGTILLCSPCCSSPEPVGASAETTSSSESVTSSSSSGTLGSPGATVASASAAETSSATSTTGVPATSSQSSTTGAASSSDGSTSITATSASSSGTSTTVSNGNASSSGGATGSSATDGGSGGSTTDGATNGDPCAGADLLCETFESTAEGAIPTDWSYNWGASADSISVQSGQSVSGTRSLRVDGEAPSSGANQVLVDAADFGPFHWGRVRYKVERVGTLASSDAGAVAHSTFLAFWDGASEFRVFDTVMNQQKKHQFLYNIQPSGDSEWGCGSAYDFTYPSAWECVEWFVSAADQSYRFFLDGTEVDSIAVASGMTDGCGAPNRSIPADLGQLTLGLYTYQAMSEGFVVWFDDLAIGTSRLGC